MRAKPLHNTMAESEGLTDAVEELLDSSGGQILLSFRDYLRRRLKALFVLLVVGFAVTFPLTKQFIAWLIDAERLPDDVEIIVTTPVEFILLQIRLSASVGMVFVLFFLIAEGSWRARKNQAIRQRLSELNVRPPQPNATLVLTIVAILILMASGLYYAWNWLIPMLLEYLTTDAQNAGLSTEWRLTGYTGFVANLALASAVGFQAPVVTLLVLRSELIQRSVLTSYRRHIWFGSFLLGAILSPPDPLSLFLVAMPVIILFELALMLDRFTRSESIQS